MTAQRQAVSMLVDTSGWLLTRLFFTRTEIISLFTYCRTAVRDMSLRLNGLLRVNYEVCRPMNVKWHVHCYLKIYQMCSYANIQLWTHPPLTHPEIHVRCLAAWILFRQYTTLAKIVSCCGLLRHLQNAFLQYLDPIILSKSLLIQVVDPTRQRVRRRQQFFVIDRCPHWQVSL